MQCIWNKKKVKSTFSTLKLENSNKARSTVAHGYKRTSAMRFAYSKINKILYFF